MERVAGLPKLVCIIAVAGSLCLLPGCGGLFGGGGASDNATGRFVLSIDWPEQTRLMPKAAQSIKVVLTANEETVAERVVARPPAGQSKTTVSFDNLPPAQLTVSATAYPQANAGGTPQATGSVVVTVEPGKEVQASLTMASTVTRVAITPPSPSVEQGGNVDLAASARDAKDRVVLTDPSMWQWTTSDAGVAKITPKGDEATVNGVAKGTATITAKETESGKSSTAQVTVTSGGGITVAVSPDRVTLGPGGKQQFQAEVQGTSNKAVTWSVVEGASGGTITQGGLYTAPDSEGTYHVKATSQADPTKSDTADVTVESEDEIRVTVSPGQVTLSPGDQQQFSAAVEGTSNKAVTWSVVEGGAGGSVTQAGLYTAPATEGVYHVMATSQADPTSSDTAEVTVQRASDGGGYVFVRKWGSKGSGQGQFENPYGVAVGPDGYVYVADTSNDRIEKFTSEGQFVKAWGSGHLEHPRAVALDPAGYLYVAEWGAPSIQKFTTSGSFVLKWGSGGQDDGQFAYPSGVAVDADGYVYVADQVNHRIQKFASSGAFVTKWGTQGSGDGQFQNAFGVAVDGAGYVYVADHANNRIQKFTSDGDYVMKWGSNGWGDGEFRQPWAIAADVSGHIFVTEYANSRIQKFTGNGEFITTWGESGSGDGQFYSPGGVAVDAAGYVYVADTGNHRIQVFRPK